MANPPYLWITLIVVVIDNSDFLKVPNAQTRAAMAEADEIASQHSARFANATDLFNDLEKSSCQ